MNDPEVIRWFLGCLVVAFIAWLFCDRAIKLWWGNGGLEIKPRDKK